MKRIANFISFSRIILSLALLFVKPLSIVFYAIYMMCGFSDVMDGFIARVTGTTSKLGAKLDSAADFVMTGVLLVVLYPIVRPTIEIVLWIFLIGIIRFAAIGVAWKKYKTFAMIHTYGNKITGIALFIFPFILPYFSAAKLMYGICVIATIAAIEEFVIQLTSSQLQLNRESIFIK